MKLGAKLFLLVMLLCAGCFCVNDAGPWVYVHTDSSGELKAIYRCDRFELEPGDVFILELHVTLPVSSGEPVIVIGVDDFAVVESLKLQTLKQEQALLRRYRWALQAVAPLESPSQSVQIEAVIEGQTNRLEFAHAPIVVKSILAPEADPLALPSFSTNTVEAAP